MATLFHAPRPYALIVWEIAEHFHWTLDYVESLSVARLAEWIQILDGRSKADSSLLK